MSMNFNELNQYTTWVKI